MDIFKIWFEYHYVSPSCVAENQHDILLNSLVCFCDPVSLTIMRFGGKYGKMEVYELLADHDILTWADFLLNFDHFGTLKFIYPSFLMLLILIKSFIPPVWKKLFEDLTGDNYVTRLHTVLHCLEDRMSVKNWYNWLCSFKFKINETAIAKWDIDLNITDMRDKWSDLCSKLLSIHNPKLQDFGRSFLHRSYHLNPTVTLYRPNVSSKCTLCHEVQETILHLYWECKYSKDLWVKVKTFVFENISEDIIMSPQSCLLSDFQIRVLSCSQ